jgi:flagellar biosynthesis/type III secretory pathway protein FliH
LDKSPEMNRIQIDDFKYPDSGKPRLNFWNDLGQPGSLSEPFSSTEPAQDVGANGSTSKEDVTRTAGELERNFQAGREQGIREGREDAEATHKARVHEIETRRIAQSADLLNRFAKDRDDLLAAIEQNVVELALAIAERVLRREAEMDPLFLLGAVRVALGQLAQSMRVRLSVPSAEAELWTETIAHIPNLRSKPEIVPDPAMQLGDCEIESEIGSASLSLSAQLETIRHALLDEPPQRDYDPVRSSATGEAGL